MLEVGKGAGKEGDTRCWKVSRGLTASPDTITFTAWLWGTCNRRLFGRKEGKEERGERGIGLDTCGVSCGGDVLRNVIFRYSKNSTDMPISTHVRKKKGET